MILENTEYATGLVRPKTTALFFDKLWIPYGLHKPFSSIIDKLQIPEDLCLENPKLVMEYEIAWCSNRGPDKRTFEIEKNYEYVKLIKDIDFIHIYDVKQTQFDSSKYFFHLRDDHEPQEDLMAFYLNAKKTINRNKIIKKVVEAYANEGISITPIFLKPSDYAEDKNNNKYNGLQVCLDFIPDIIEKELSWDQVLEFRKDKDAIDKLQRFRRWFNIDLLNKTEKEIQNILGQKLDDYCWALKKHGIQTGIGGLTSFVSFLAGSTLMQLFTNSPLASISTGIPIAMGAIAWIKTKMIEKYEISRDPIAYIYEVEKLVK